MNQVQQNPRFSRSTTPTRYRGAERLTPQRSKSAANLRSQVSQRDDEDKLRPGFTAFRNDLLELAMSKLNGTAEFRLCLYIGRLTSGWQREWQKFRLHQAVEQCALSESAVYKAKKALIARSIIEMRTDEDGLVWVRWTESYQPFVRGYLDTLHHPFVRSLSTDVETNSTTVQLLSTSVESQGLSTPLANIDGAVLSEPQDLDPKETEKRYKVSHRQRSLDSPLGSHYAC